MNQKPIGLYARRLNPALQVLLVVVGLILVAACGFLLLGQAEGQEWGFLDCIYFTVISLTTVGYGETLPNFESHPLTRVYTMLVLLVGYGVMVWAVSTIIAEVVEGRFSEILGRRRMMAEIAGLRDHYILCGMGQTGIHILEEMCLTRRDVVVIERDHERLAEAAREYQFRFLEGDAESEELLRAAGIERAAGFVACLPEDKDNIYLVLTARQMNPRLRIIARSIHMESQAKLLRAGANVAVSPNMIGGLRMASELMRPHVTTFLDYMLRDKSEVVRIEEVTIPAGSPVDGRTIGQVDVSRKTGLLILATRDEDGEHFTFKPGGDHVLRSGMALVVLGAIEDVVKLRELVHP